MNFRYSKVTRREFVALAFAIVCLFLDFYPRHGPPHFRYTGSDPAIAVWNFGWPLVLAIYDQRSGLHFGPFLYAVISSQVLVLVMALASIIAVRRLRNQPAMSPD